jgi:hypothetical protein
MLCHLTVSGFHFHSFVFLQIGDIICFNFSGLCGVIAPRRIYHVYLDIYLAPIISKIHFSNFSHNRYNDNNVVPNSFSAFPIHQEQQECWKPKEFAFDVYNTYVHNFTCTTAECARRD